MKKSFKYILAIILCLCFVLTGCSSKLDMPSGAVESNGGSVVMVGNYVYYANTYVDYSSLSGNANTDKTTKQNSLYRVKTNDYGFTTRDEDDFIENIEKVKSKIAGFNNSNMFIVGDYLYFTSPNTHKDKKGEDLFNLTTLFRIKLDGTEFKEILTTKTTQGKFFLVTDDNPYLLIFDNEEISKLEIKTKLSSSKVLVKNVLDAVFPKNYSTLDYVYYTSDISESDKTAGLSGNKLNRLDLKTGNTQNIVKPDKETITLVTYEFGQLYYKKLDTTTNVAYYYSNTMQSTFESGEKKLTVVGETSGSDDEVSGFTPINKDNYVFKYNSQLRLNMESNALVSEDATIEVIYGDYVYYSTSSGIYRISYKDKNVQTVAEKENIQQGAIEIAGEYVYFYAKTANNSTDTYYCHRANNKVIEDGRTRVECIAEVLADDIEEDE